MPAGAPSPLVLLAALAATGAVLTACTSAHPDSGGRTTRAAAAVSTAVTSAPSVATPSPAGTVIGPSFSTTPPSTPASTAHTPSDPASSARSTIQPPAPATPATPADRLPLDLPTGSATRVLTVVAPSTASTTATLQAWQRSGAGWARVGPAIPAWLGSDGLSAHPSESRSATPIGSFGLTEAFGREADPGTGLPYRQTTPADWWISQPGPLYNTLQHCVGACPFVQGEPNEHLSFTTPFYDYAVVIDYNRAPVVQGAGSAFFLHVAVGGPTQGCVAIPRANLVTILRWLTPSAHPRMLIGVR